MDISMGNLSVSFNYMIDLYLKEKQNKFAKHNPILNITKFLIIIYGEINIINPYLSQNLSVLLNNLTVYGLKKSEVQEFLDNLEEFYQKYIANRCLENTELLNQIYFNLIDMVKSKGKKQLITISEFASYEELIYSKNNVNPVIKLYNLLINKKPDAIGNYWYKVKTELLHPVVEVNKPLLAANIYQNYGLSYDEVSKLSVNEIVKLNARIQNEMDTETSGGRTVENPKKLILTSGNAVIDSVLLLGFIATGILVGFIILLGFIRG